MIQGLNQLGAASGVAMGGLAKRFSEASGGAISLRESMEATAKAVSSGLSQAQFLKLGDVAKKASQALGVNMSDAVSRLTRGITKLEPELLDELGIFTKVGKATEDYARAIGKPVSALTDFEKRQAFANAVLEEGAKKFGQIDIPTNPYDKLLATLKNVAQAGLEIVNNVLGPFANLLAKNSGLLVGVLALIGAKIVKDALPAIGQWRAGLKLAADEARQRSSDIATSFGEKFVERTNAAFRVPDLKSDLQKAEKDYSASRMKFSQIDNDYAKKRKGSQFYESVVKGTTSPAAIQKEINLLKDAGIAADAKVIKNLEAQKLQLQQIRALRKDLAKAEIDAANYIEGGAGSIGDSLRSRAAKNARRDSMRLDILSNVSTNSREQGFLPAIAEMNKELKSSKTLDGLDKFRVRVGGVFIAAANSVGLFMSAFSNILGPVMAVVGILTAVLPLMRNNEEEAARFAASLDLLKENSENSFRVLERLSKLDPLERISVDSIFAKGTALESLGGSLTKAFDDFETELKNRNWADSTLNFLSSIIGRSSEQLLAKQVGNSIERAVQLSASGPNGRAVQAELANLLKLPANASTFAITDALRTASPEIRKAAGKIIEDAGKKAVASAGSFKAFKEGLVESGKVYQDLINTTKNSTPLTKFAEESSKKILDLAKTLANADLPEKLTALRDLSTDINFLQLFPPEAARNIISTSTELNKLSSELAEAERLQTIYNQALNEQQAIIDKDAARSKQQGGKGARISKPQSVLDAEAAVENLNKVSAGLQRTKSSIGTALETSSAKFAESMRIGLIANIDTFTRGLVDAAKKSKIELQKSALQGVSDPRLKARLDANLEQQTINVERNLLKTQLSLIDSNADLRLAIMENTLSQNLDKAGIKGSPEDILSQLFKPENKGLLENYRAVNSFRDNRGKTSAQLRKEIETQGLSAGTIQGISESVGQAQSRESINAQLEALAGKSQIVDLNKTFALIEADKTVALKDISDRQKIVDQEQQRLAQKKDSMTDAEYQASLSILTISKTDLEYAAKVVEATTLRAKSLEAAKVFGEKAVQSELDYSEKSLANTIAQESGAREIAILTSKTTTSIAEAVRLKDLQMKASEQDFIVTSAALDRDISRNKLAQDDLSLQAQLGRLDEATLKTKMDALKIEEAKLDQTKQLTAAQRAYNQEIEKLDRDKAAAGGTYIGDKAADDERARANAKKNFEDQRAGILLVTEARIKDAETIASVSLRQQAYTDLFKQGFKGMEDAIINFTKTGKLSFSSMIDSFIEGLLRYEIQQQQSMLFKSVGGASGLATSLMGFLGFSTGGTDAGSLNILQAGARGYNAEAMGGVYDAGLRKFAQGGMFTNSIVSSPTLFKFAQGTGLMGEAGPEAIMPLKRDSSGNLGVRAGTSAPTVDVVVNNFGNQQATTKETTDSRGNRRIEVMIGDAVAGELSRPGSSVQQSLSGNFGNKPALARR
jgi:hypothetical protein